MDKKEKNTSLPWSWFEAPEPGDIEIPGVRRRAGINELAPGTAVAAGRRYVPPSGIPWEKRYRIVHYAKWFTLPDEMKQYVVLMNKLSFDKKVKFTSHNEKWTDEGKLMILVRYVRLVDTMFNKKKEENSEKDATNI